MMKVFFLLVVKTLDCCFTLPHYGFTLLIDAFNTGGVLGITEDFGFNKRVFHVFHTIFLTSEIAALSIGIFSHDHQRNFLEYCIDFIKTNPEPILPCWNQLVFMSLNVSRARSRALEELWVS